MKLSGRTMLPAQGLLSCEVPQELDASMCSRAKAAGGIGACWGAAEREFDLD